MFQLQIEYCYFDVCKYKKEKKKLKMLVNGKSKSPCCKEVKCVEVDYDNKNSWMTVEIFDKWKKRAWKANEKKKLKNYFIKNCTAHSQNCEEKLNFISQNTFFFFFNIFGKN